MRLGEEIRRQRLERGYSLRQLEEKTGICYASINAIELGKSKTSNRLDTILTLARKAEFEIHPIAHAAFELDPPEDMGELEGTFKQICEMIRGLNASQRERLRNRIEGWIEGMNDANDARGGGASDGALNARSGFG